MNHTPTGRVFLKWVGLATIALSVGSASLAQEQAQSPGDAGVQGMQLAEYPWELMICDYVRFKLSRVDQRGKIIWEHSYSNYRGFITIIYKFDLKNLLL